RLRQLGLRWESSVGRCVHGYGVSGFCGERSGRGRWRRYDRGGRRDALSHRRLEGMAIPESAFAAVSGRRFPGRDGPEYGGNPDHELRSATTSCRVLELALRMAL